MKPRISDPRRGQQGFVLVVVLVLLVVLTLLAATIALSGTRAVESAQHEIDLFQGELDMLSTRETVLFMYSTQHRNPAGLVVDQLPAYSVQMFDDDADGKLMLPTGNELRLDSTPYGGLGEARFALQDDRGLISLNWAMPFMRQAYYRHLGARPEEMDGLDAKRLDYQDPDSLHRLNGAEKDHYAGTGLPPPTNRALTTPLEFRRILQWNTLLQDTSDADLLRSLSMTREATLNPNTAPVEVLELLPGMNRAQAERMVALRRQTPFTTSYQVEQAFPISSLLSDALIPFPNQAGNLILWDRRFGASRLTHWTLTPMEINGAPWRIDYEVILPRDDRTGEVVVETPATPLFASKDAAGE